MKSSFRYDTAAKKEFLQAAVTALSEGKGNDAAMTAALAHGYRGTKGGLEAMIRKERALGRLPSSRPKPFDVDKARKRLSGITGESLPYVVPVQPPAQVGAPELGDLNNMINNIVNKRVGAVLSRIKQVVEEGATTDN
jgi:hypothetical protein